MEQATTLKPKFLTPTELVDRYRGKIALRTLTNWRALGTGPRFTRIGGRVLYSLEEVETWERSQVRGKRGRPRRDGATK